ncbi:MAG TPA: hypothetical protein VHE60_06070 [Pyrinomonadaceae bacterium]|nr:hypothetical protein [Pyrinomonadaceae bacterium]
MFNSNVLDVAIGMIFVYLLLSLLCSAANEILELWLKKRATDLERGIRELLTPNSASGTNNDLVHKLYDHALINGLFKGQYAESGIVAQSRPARFWRWVKGTKLPAYIPSRNFALGLMDLILPGTAPAAPTPDNPAPPPPVASGAAGATPATFAVSLTAVPPTPTQAIAAGNPLQPLRAALGTNPLIAANPIAQKSLIALVDAAGNDVAKARENIEAWFNNSMDRVSGWYKRRSQVIILVIGLFVAIAVNADSLAITKRLWTDRALRESLVSAADAYAKANAEPRPKPSPSPTPPGSDGTKPVAKAGNLPASTPSEKATPNPALARTVPIGFVAHFDHAARATPTPTARPTPTAVATPHLSTAATQLPSGTPPPSPLTSPPAEAITTASPMTSPAAGANQPCFEGFGLKVCGPVWLVVGVIVLGACFALLVVPKVRHTINKLNDGATKWIGILLAVVFVLLFFGNWLFGGNKSQVIQSPTPTPSASPTVRDSPTVSPTPKPSTMPAPSVASPKSGSSSTPETPSTPKPPSATSPTPPPCAYEACNGNEDSPQCKLKKATCEIEGLGLPIGWTPPEDRWPGLHFWTLEFWTNWAIQFRLHGFGWLLTAFAVSLGAPFWFDMLNKLIVVRSTVKPKEKSQDEPSKS